MLISLENLKPAPPPSCCSSPFETNSVVPLSGAQNLRFSASDEFEKVSMVRVHSNVHLSVGAWDQRWQAHRIQCRANLGSSQQTCRVIDTVHTVRTLTIGWARTPCGNS